METRAALEAEAPPDVLDETCPTRQILDLIADKWTVLIIYALADGTKRYNQMQRLVGGITPKMLTQTLRRLEINGLVTRTVHPVIPPHVDYTLTPLGKTLLRPLTELCNWAENHFLEVEAARATARQTQEELTPILSGE